MLDMASSDPFDHRNVDIGLSATEWRAIGLQEEACEEKCGALIAIGQRMIPCQVFHQRRSLLQDRRVGLDITKPGLRCGKC